MPFVVPPQNQPQPAQPAQPQPQPQYQARAQPQQGRGGMNMQSMSPFQNRIGMQGGGQPLPRYGGEHRPQYGAGPLSIAPPQRQQQFYGGGQPHRGPMPQMMHNPYQQQGGGRPMPWGYDQGDAYTKDMRFNSPPPPPQFSNRPMQGTFVGEGVYADGTPMPPPQQPGLPANPAALSLIQSNGAPQGGVYGSGFGARMPSPGTSPVQNPYGRSGRGGGSGSTY